MSVSIPFTEPEITPSFGYVTGVLKGDGWISHKKPYLNSFVIGLSATDLDFVETFAFELFTLTGKDHTKKIRESLRLPPYHNMFIVCVHDKNWGRYFRTIPDEELIALISKASPSVKKRFLQGFFDSEGCVQIVTQTSPKLIISAYNTNKTVAYGVISLLESLGFNPTIILRLPDEKRINIKPIYTITLQQRNEAVLFMEQIGFSIKRKQDKLNKFLQLWNEWQSNPESEAHKLSKKKWQRYTANRAQKHRAESKEYYQKNKAACDEYHRKWHAKNKEKESQRKKDYYWANREKILARRHERFLQHPEEHNAKIRKRYAEDPEYRKRKLDATKARAKRNREKKKLGVIL